MKIAQIPPASDMKVAIAAIQRELPDLLKMAGIVAELRRESYKQYLKQGFTAEQALELCSQPLIV